MKHCETHVIRAVNLWCCPYQFMAISLGILNIGKTQATYSLLIYIYTQYIYIVYIFCKYEYMSIHVYKNRNKYIPLYQHSISTSASASRTASWPRAEHPGGDDRWGWKLRKRFQDPLVMSKWWSSWRFHHDITGKWCFFFF